MYFAFPEHGQEQPSNDPRVAYEDVILDDGKMKRTEFAYDQFNNVTLITERDFGTAGNPGAVLRKMQKTYLAAQNGYCYTNLNGLSSSCADGIPSNIGAVVHQRHVLLSEKVLDASDNQKALAEYEYDNYAADSNHAAVIANSSMINYEGGRFSLFSSSSEPRGNATRVRNWAGGSDYIYAYTQYDNAGNVIMTKDPNGNVSTVSYADNFGNGTDPDSGAGGNFGATFAFPTLATNALGWQSKVQYDFTLGAAAGTKDINDVISRVEFDSIGRPFRTIAASGTSLAVKTEASYPTATSNVATASSQIDATNWSASKVEYDGFDRPFKGWRSEDGKHASEANFTIVTQTVFDALSRGKQVSNPYRPAAGETLYYTTSKYDLAGRVTEVETPDGAKVKSAYDGSRTLVEDQAGKKRISKTNALGQLSDVWEITASDSATESVTFPNYSGLYGYKTSYSYDLLNNLTLVDQGDQERSFAYDGLSRLSSATNPESGTISYTYDANGNLKTKRDARNIKTVYDYDVLNRVLTRCYRSIGGGSLGMTTCVSNSETAEPNTSTVSHTYEDTNVTSLKGVQTEVTNGNSTTEYTSFDILGRVTGHQQTTDGGASGGYTTGYTFNLSGALIEETYPSGRVVKNVLDNNGDLETVKSKKNSNQGYFDYSKNFTYNAAGAVTSMQLGNGRWESTVFNSRLQPTQIALGTVQNGTDKLELDYSYGSTVNNGNIQNQTITIAGTGGFTANQTYSYDSLNRLQQAYERPDGWTESSCTSDPTKCWKQTFTFDRYGNRRFDEVNTTMPASFANPAVTNPTISTSNNRLTSSGYSYDAAGNTTYDAALRKFTYDGENKQTKVESTNSSQQVTGTVGEYWYDGDGKRVKKIAGDEVTIFVYDAAGKLVAEYSTIVASAEDAKVAYLTNDHLGSPRINTDANGAATARHDYHPFGEEIVTSQRISALGYADDSVRKQFTGYERDDETDLDYAQARYYSRYTGRFATTDPINITAERLIDPQRVNLYVYVRNNPLAFIDPSGLDVVVAGSNENVNRFLSTVKDKTKLGLTAGKDGKLDYEGGKRPEGLKGTAAKIADALDNHNKTANIRLVENDGAVDFGTPFSLDDSGNLTTSVQSIDFGDIDKAKAAVASLEGTVVVHETLEAIAFQIDGKKTIEEAHNAAIKGGAPGFDFQPGKTPTFNVQVCNGVYMNYSVPFQVGSLKFTVEYQYRNQLPLPLPSAPPKGDYAALTKFRQQYPVDIIKVTK